MLEYFGQLIISGQRAVKIVKPDHNDQLSWIYTYYIYDATGNVMATYTRRNYFDDIGDSSFAFVNDWIYNELGLTDLQDFVESKFSYNGQFMNDWIEYLSTNELASGVFDEFSPDDFLGWDATLVPAVLSNFAHSPNASPTENDALLNAILSNQQSNFVSSVLNSGTAVLNNALTAILSNDPTDLLLNCMATNNPVGLNSVYVSLGGSPVPPPTNASRIAYIRSFPPPTIASQISAIESISNLQNYFSSCLNSTMIYNSWNSSQPNISFTDLFDAWSSLGDTSLILDVIQNHYSNDAHLRILLKEVRTLQQLYQLASSSNYSNFVSNSINATSYQDLSFVMYQSSALTFSSYLKMVRTHFGSTTYSSMMSDIGELLKFGKDITWQEQHIYGSSRLGMYQSGQLLVKYKYKYKYSDTLQIYLDSVKFDRDTNRAMRKLSHKQYELSNHLGNVLSTVLDRKTPITSSGGSGGSGGSTTITHFEGDVVFASDYYPFGSPMPWTTSDSSGGRLYSGVGYRYGYQNQEKDVEIFGEGNAISFKYRIHDTRLGRFLSIDPLAREREWVSPYNFCQNSPLSRIDPTGALDEWVKKDGKMMYDSRVTNQEDATAFYGDRATYINIENGYTYTASDGSSIELGYYGFFKQNGQIKSSPDLAETAITSAPVDQSGIIMAGGLLISGGLLADNVTGVGVVDDVAIPPVIVVAGVAALVAKATYEIQKIQERDPGPQGIQYSLRATTSGAYPCYTCPGGTMNLNVGDVWKYGETTNPTGRYSLSQLSGWKVEQIDEFRGSQMQIKIAEKSKIYNYFLTNGQLPPGNKIFR